MTILVRIVLTLAALVVSVGRGAVLDCQSPWTIKSSKGSLNVLLYDARSQVDVAGRKNVWSRVWNDSFVAPMLVVRPGDNVSITLVNQLEEPTNLHFHGLRISPRKPADDSLYDIAPHMNFTYRFTVPKDHPTGLFWYHSHVVGASSEMQVFSGMSGGLVIEGILSSYEELIGVQEQLLLLRDIQVPIPRKLVNSNAPTTRLVNGCRMPVLRFESGNTTLFSFANIGADIFYKIAIRPRGMRSGHQGGMGMSPSAPSESASSDRLPMLLLAVDGQVRNKLTAYDKYMLGPGSRAQFIVTFPEMPTDYVLETLFIDTGVMRPRGSGMNGPMHNASRMQMQMPGGGDQPMPIDTYPRKTLAILRVSGKLKRPTTSFASPHLLIAQPPRDLRTMSVSQNRTIIYSENMSKREFFINNLLFNSSRVDFQVKLGSLERWTIINRGDMLHTFHLHQGQYQVVSVGDEIRDFQGYEDSTIIPTPMLVKEGNKKKLKKMDVPVVVLIPFFDRYQLGRYAFHCHILSHEDNGMMMVLEVIP